MKIKNASYRWIIDFVLLTSFLLAYFLDWTGLTLHQLLGIFVGLFSAYHLVIHWDWVVSVFGRLAMKTSGRSRLYFGLDLGIFVGLLIILVTGLIISTWLNLVLVSYDAWLKIHILASIGTLGLLGLKIMVHWRWIVMTAKKIFVRPERATMPASPRVASSSQSQMSRRDFLRVAVPAGAVTLAAAGMAIRGLTRLGAGDILSNESVVYAQDLSTPTTSSAISTQTTPTAESTSSAAVQPTAAATTQAAVQTTPVNACTIRCPRGCSYPGHCRRYTDSNNNNRCDLGECL